MKAVDIFLIAMYNVFTQGLFQNFKLKIREALKTENAYVGSGSNDCVYTLNLTNVSILYLEGNSSMRHNRPLGVSFEFLSTGIDLNRIREHFQCRLSRRFASLDEECREAHCEQN